MEMTILFVGFAILLVLGAPITFAMAIPATIAFMVSPDLPSTAICQKLFAACDSFSLMAMPFFMLAGGMMNEIGITKRIVDFANSLVGHIRGGLAHTTSLAGMIMAGISGSANADAAALGGLLLSPLIEDGYDEGFACGLVSTCGVLGVVIPPSILMVVYSGVSNVSISKLFMAGIIPGIMCGVFYMVYAYIYARVKKMPRRKFMGWGYVWSMFKQAIGALIMPIIIIGSILGGICTATESGMLAVVYGLLYGIITRQLDYKKLKRCTIAAARATAMSMSMIAMACVFSYIMTRMNFPEIVTAFMTNNFNSKYGTIFAIIVILIIMGMFVDSNAAMLMMVPIFAPICQVYGLDTIHFSMIILLSMINGGLTPPVGLVLYIVASIKNIPLKKACTAVWAFVGINVFVLVLVVFFPSIVTFIPNTLLG